MAATRLDRPLLVLAGLLLAGCATHRDQLLTVRTAFYSGDLPRAEMLLDQAVERGRGDAEVLRLERAVVQLAGGRPADAEQDLRLVRDRFEELEQKSLAESAAALLTDDQTLAYAGEDYERVLIRAFLAVANLMQGGGDAEAYCLQVMDKQAQIIQSAVQEDGSNPKAGYQQVAFAPYLRAALREETHRDFDDVLRYREMVVSWRPDFQPGQDDLARARFGRHSAPGNGVLHVIALVGRGPYKEEVEEIPTTISLLIADRILSAAGKHTLPPNVAPIKVPKVVAFPNTIQGLAVQVDGATCGFTSTITDVGQMAVAQNDAELPRVIGRAVARRAVKKGTVYAAKEALGVQRGSVESVALDVAGVVWEATERADTRCWGLLPDRIQVLRLELPAGQHQITLQPLDRAGRIIGTQATQQVEVLDARNTYLLAHFPGPALAGEILASAR
jgi:hypothetical protein